MGVNEPMGIQENQLDGNKGVIAFAENQVGFYLGPRSTGESDQHLYRVACSLRTASLILVLGESRCHNSNLFVAKGMTI